VWYAGLDVPSKPAYHRIGTIDTPVDEHLVARIMQRIGINKYKINNCASCWLFTKNVINCKANKTQKSFLFVSLLRKSLDLRKSNAGPTACHLFQDATFIRYIFASVSSQTALL